MIDRRLRVIAVPVMVFVATVAVATSGASQSTPWGDPDLQGTWTSSGATPMERPDDLQGRELLTDEEVSSIRARTAARDLELLNAPAQRTEVTTNPGAYNNFWMDRGARTNRTSMIVDPPDGKFPPLTPTGEWHSETQLKAPGGAEKDDTWEDRHIWERCVLRTTRGEREHDCDRTEHGRRVYGQVRWSRRISCTRVPGGAEAEVAALT